MMKVKDLVERVYNGEIVLPEFQRSFVWEPEEVRELLVSILGDYFIGTMLILECIKDESPFALRLIEGVDRVNSNAKMSSIVQILLDGQQRTTALFYALYEPDIPLKGRKSPYRFYLDIEKAFSGEWDEAVIAVNLNDKRKLKEIEQNKNIIPFSYIRKISEELNKIYPDLVKRFEGDHEKIGKLIELANNFMNREIHIIKLPQNTDANKIVETFERLNRTGKPLSVFDLFTAKLYKHDLNLRELLANTKQRYKFINQVKPETILKVIAIMRGKYPKRRNLLELEPDNFEEDWYEACESLEKAYERITDLKDGYGVLDFKRWMPYSSMIVPLAVMLWYVRKNRLDLPLNYRKIDTWYWVSVFTNRYDQAVDSKSFEDFKAIKKWIEEGKKPEFIESFNPEEIDFNVDKQSNAIYRGVMSLIVLKGARDFKTGEPPQFDPKKVQDDHIFPKSIFNEDRVLNRTLITSNQSKFNEKPSEYFRERLEEHGREILLEILESHLIPPEALDYLLNDDLESFMESRRKAIIEEIKRRVSIAK